MEAEVKVVYLVTAGYYSDYRVQGVFSTQANAERFMENSGGKQNFNDIKLGTLDIGLSQLDLGLKPFSVSMLVDGNGLRVVADTCDLEPHKTGWLTPKQLGADRRFIVGVWAEDETHAIKIANEKRIVALVNDRS